MAKPVNRRQKNNVAMKVLAIVLAAAAGRLALRAMEKLWTKGLRKPVPGGEEEASLMNRVAWVGATTAAAGIAREVIRELTAPKHTNSQIQS
jgi:hypothetical protein